MLEWAIKQAYGESIDILQFQMYYLARYGHNGTPATKQAHQA